MRVVEVSRHGGGEVLRTVERPTPEPGAGEVLVDVAAAGVNYIDTYHRSGLYPLPTPFVLGQEGAGRVAAVGDGVTAARVGDRVAWTGVTGSYAEQVVVPAASAAAGAGGARRHDGRGAAAAGHDGALPRHRPPTRWPRGTRCWCTPPPAGSGCSSPRWSGAAAVG